MTSEIKIQPLHSYDFFFYDDTFKAYLATDRNWYIPLNAVCQALDIDTVGQRQRIERDEAINDRLILLPLETPYQDTTRVREVYCLNLRTLPYWLGTIDTSRIKSEHKNKVILFKREFAEAAWAVFRSDIVPGEILQEMDTYATPDEQALNEMMDKWRAMRKQVDLMSGKVDAELERIGAKFSDLEARLGAMEGLVNRGTPINDSQQTQLHKMMELVAEALHAKTREPKTMCWAQVHNDFKETFEIFVFTALPANQYQKAVELLTGRWRRLNPGKELPEIFGGSYQQSLL